MPEEECWPYIQRLTEEVEALAPRKLLVLGGLGAAWMRQTWEGQQFFSAKTDGKMEFGKKLWVLSLLMGRAPKIHW